MNAAPDPRRRCPLCGATESRPLARYSTPRPGGEGSVGLSRCGTCRHVFTTPRPRPTELSGYYGHDYWGRLSEGRPTDSFKVGGLPWREFMTRRAEPILERRNRGRLLEVGCGDGLFLYFMRENGWDVHGVEPGGAAGRHARNVLGLEVSDALFDGFVWNGPAFDVIFFHHSLEHLDDPTQAILKARDLLASDGFLVITSPNFGSFDRWVFGRYWWQLDLPRHLHHFTARTLRNLLRTAGLNPVGVRYSSSLGLWPGSYLMSARNAWHHQPAVAQAASGGSAPIAHDPTAPPPAQERISLRGLAAKLAHRVEYPLFMATGRLTDRLRLGSNITLVAQRA